MNGSLHIGNLFGIPIRLHWTFLLLVYLAASASPAPFPVALAFFAAVAGSVLLHELGHSLMARRFGIRVIDITFWPLGGMARMTEVPEHPRVEGLVAIAGPAVNFVLALASGILMVVFGILAMPTAVQLVGWFLWVNLMLGAFNLIPAFPLDGGRILRAWFARTTDWVSATQRAVEVGRVFAILMFVASIVSLFFGGGLCVLPLIAIFIWFAGANELVAVRMRHGQGPFGFPGTGFGGEPPFAPRPGAPMGNPIDPMTPPPPPRGGFSEDYIRRLERSHGRLTRRPGNEDL